MYTLLYLKRKTDKDLLYSTGTLLSVMWQPGWEGIQGRRDTHICVAESFCYGKHTDSNHPPWPDTTARLHELFSTGGPSKEHETNKPPPTGRVWERSKGDTTCLTTSQNTSLWHPSWLNKAGTTRKDSETE